MRYSCNVCEKPFDIYSTYYSHTRRHLPPKKQCEFCQISFYSNQDRFRHVGKYHRPGCTIVQQPATQRPVEQTSLMSTRTPSVDTERKNSLIPAMFR